MSACKTPGAVFHISTHPDRVEVSVEFNRDIPITEEQAKALHDRIHDAIEAALAPVFGSAALEEAMGDEIEEAYGNLRAKHGRKAGRVALELLRKQGVVK